MKCTEKRLAIFPKCIDVWKNLSKEDCLKILCLLVFTTLLGACGDSGESVESIIAQRQKYFKSIGGTDAARLPLFATREYDNKIQGYSIWTECGSSDIGLFSSQTDLPLQNNELPGPSLISTPCTIDITYDYQTGTPIVTGTLNTNGIDVTLAPITQSEYIEALKTPEIDFENYHNSQSVFDQDNRLSRMCEDLFDQTCAEALSF